MSEDVNYWKLKPKQAFADLRQPSTLIEIKVDGWDISVYYWRAMNVAEKRAVQIAYASNDVYNAHVSQLIARARNDQGQPLYTEREREDLMTRWSADEIERVSLIMLKDRDEPTLETETKNS